MSRLVAVAPVLPEHVYPQAEITATLGGLLTTDGSTARAVLERVHGATGVVTRHLALPLDRYASLRSFGTANDVFVTISTDLAEQAVRAALRTAGLEPIDVDFLLFTSVTGISAPSVDALLVDRLGMRPDVRRMPSFGLGCAGGAAGVARVDDYLAGHRQDVGVLVSVELCSLTVQHGDDSMANLVASGLFGDGAAAVVMVGDDHPAATGPSARPGPSVLGTGSRLYPGTADHLGWHVQASGFRIVLTSELPDVVRTHLADDVTSLLEEHDLKMRDVATWLVHPGGPRILDAVQDALELDAEELDLSRRSLAAVGNLSSASVLHVLADAWARDDELPDSPSVLLAFGPGVSADLVLLGRASEA